MLSLTALGYSLSASTILGGPSASVDGKVSLSFSLRVAVAKYAIMTIV